LRRVEAGTRQSRAPRALVWKTVLSDHPSTNGFETNLGARVRALRRERGLTLKGLGRLAGLSHPFLSQVERGLARPSVGSVERIAAALDVSVAHLWSPPRRREAVRVVRRDEGEIREHGDSTLRELLGEPGTPTLREWSARSRRWPAETEVHTGEVALYVARGQIEVDLGGAIHALAEGDAVRFDGAIPHRLRRTGGTGTRALLIHVG
jgi:transcriptional regulator with XRE-family HTH domain